MQSSNQLFRGVLEKQVTPPITIQKMIFCTLLITADVRDTADLGLGISLSLMGVV